MEAPVATGVLSVRLLLVPFRAPAIGVVGELAPSPDDRGEPGLGSPGR